MKIKKFFLLFVIVFAFSTIYTQALFLKNKKDAIGYEIGYSSVEINYGYVKSVAHLINATLFKHINLFFGHSNNYGRRSINSTLLGISIYLTTKEENTFKPVLNLGKSNSGDKSSMYFGTSLYLDFIKSRFQSFGIFPYIEAGLIVQSGGYHIIGAGFDLGYNINDKFVILLRPCGEYLIESEGVGGFSISISCNYIL